MAMHRNCSSTDVGMVEEPLTMVWCVEGDKIGEEG
jgi:hypothetical protein